MEHDWGHRGPRQGWCVRGPGLNLGLRTSLWKGFMTRWSWRWQHRFWSSKHFSYWAMTFFSFILCSLPFRCLWGSFAGCSQGVAEYSPSRDPYALRAYAGLLPVFLVSAPSEGPCCCFLKILCWFFLFHNLIIFNTLPFFVPVFFW